MRQLRQRTPNSPEYTDNQFAEVWTGELGGVDEDRFRLLMSKYKEGRILDIGCFDSPIPIWYENCVGVDYSPETIRTLKDVYPEAEYVCADALRLPFKDEEFDYIVAGETIEHIKDLERFSKEMNRVLKKGGILALSTPHDEGTLSQVSDQHVWSFVKGDMAQIFDWGEVEEEISTLDRFETIIAFVKKW